MPEPIVTSINLDKPILSDELDFQNGNITFTFDQDVIAYSVKCVGTSYNTGMNVEEGNKYVSSQATNVTVAEASLISVKEFRVFPAETLISAEISYTELYQEGENRVNVYGESVDRIWSIYDQTGEPPPEEPPVQNIVTSNINFVGKLATNAEDVDRLIYYEDFAESEISPLEVSWEPLNYEGIYYQNDGQNLLIVNYQTAIQVVFSFKVTAFTNIQSFNFQLNDKTNTSFRMKYWNFVTSSWDDSTLVTGTTEGFYEIGVNTVAPYIGETDYVHIMYWIDAFVDINFDYANLVIERLE